MKMKRATLKTAKYSNQSLESPYLKTGRRLWGFKGKSVITLSLLLLTDFAAAQDNYSLKSSDYGDNILTPFAVLKIFVLLLLVIALIMAGVWMLKKFSPQLARGYTSGIITVLSTTYLGPKRAFFLIEVLDRIMLVGVTECDIRLIAEFTDPNEIERIRSMSSKKSGKESFSAALASVFAKKQSLKQD